MNQLKSILVGEVLSNHADILEDGEISPVLETPPPGTQEIRRITGVVGLIMEEDPAPGTIAELRAKLREEEWNPTETAGRVEYTIHDLLASGVIKLTPDRRLSYNPPDSQYYRNILMMPEHR